MRSSDSVLRNRDHLCTLAEGFSHRMTKKTNPPLIKMTSNILSNFHHSAEIFLILFEFELTAPESSVKVLKGFTKI